MRKAFKKAMLFSAAAAGAAIGGVHGLYRYIFRSPSGRQNDDYLLPGPFRSQGLRARSLALIDALNSHPFEKVGITSFDGLALSGRYYHTSDGAPVAILCHGYRGTPSRDFCGGADICFFLGCNVLLIEQRAHCSSGGHTITFGVNERRDVLSWCNWAAERFHAPILLAGISMGGAAVLMASELDLPDNVRGIVADCPYTSPRAIIRRECERKHFPAALLMPPIRLSARLFGGFSLSEPVNAVEAVRHARVPILLIHGEEDDYVPCDMSREIAAANPKLVEFHTFPGAWHGASYLVNTERYTRIMRAFCYRVLPELKPDDMTTAP